MAARQELETKAGSDTRTTIERTDDEESLGSEQTQWLDSLVREHQAATHWTKPEDRGKVDYNEVADCTTLLVGDDMIASAFKELYVAADTAVVCLPGGYLRQIRYVMETTARQQCARLERIVMWAGTNDFLRLYKARIAKETQVAELSEQLVSELDCISKAIKVPIFWVLPVLSVTTKRHKCLRVGQELFRQEMLKRFEEREVLRIHPIALKQPFALCQDGVHLQENDVPEALLEVQGHIQKKTLAHREWAGMIDWQCQDDTGDRVGRRRSEVPHAWGENWSGTGQTPTQEIAKRDDAVGH